MAPRPAPWALIARRAGIRSIYCLAAALAQNAESAQHKQDGHNSRKGAAEEGRRFDITKAAGNPQLLYLKVRELSSKDGRGETLN
ncbi:MAG: hypothetical protein R3C39_05510 [Dehalococcoidia bacterium]